MNVIIDAIAERRLWAFIRSLKTEVGGMGYATLDGDNVLWRETFLIPQEVSSSEVDFEATNGDSVAIERATADGVLDDPSFIWVSWHSHHTMDAFWSGTDDKRINAIGKMGVKRLVSFVGAHDGTYKLRADIFDVQAHDVNLGQVTISDLTLGRASDDFTQAISDEIDANVKTRKYLSTWAKDGDKGKKGFIESLMPTPDRDESLSISESFIIRDLTDEGYSRADAERMLGNLGAEDCESLLTSNMGLGQYS